VNLEHIRTFLEVAATGNFQQAGKRLHVTQSTVSARIKVLEQQLERTLFNRHRYGVSLTAAGRQFQRHAESVVRSWQRARQEVSLPVGFEAILGIGAVFPLYDRLLPEWTLRMRQQVPRVALKSVVEFSSELNNFLADGLIDIGVMYQPRNAPGLISEPLMEDELLLISNRPRRVRRDWISDYILVDWGDAFLDEHARAFPDMEAPALSVGLEDLALRHLLGSGGSAYLSQHRAQPYLERGELYAVERAPRFKRASYVVYPASPTDEPLLNLALDTLRSVARKE
jgi:DNA-binding transcriptional LysR family regulator